MRFCLLVVQTAAFWYAGQWMRPEYGADKRRLYSESNGNWLGGLGGVGVIEDILLTRPDPESVSRASAVDTEF